MIDEISKERIKLLHPKVRDEVTTLMEAADVVLSGKAGVRITQGLRTIEEQNALYAQGRTKPGKIVTNAKGGSSYHNYGLAIDFVLILDGKEVSWNTLKDYDGDKEADWMEVIHLFKAAGWESGSDWQTKDMPHLQKSFGYTWQQLFKKYKDENFLESYIKL